jgi:hypothetical protein
MVVTPFGDLALDDKTALDRWVDAHARRHNAYVRASGIAGGNLRGKVDADWFHRHLARHISLATYRAIDLSSSTAGLGVSGWDSEEELKQWHELHNRIHLKIDRQLGIT